MNFQYGEDKIWLENEEGKQIALIEFPKVKEGLVNITHTEVDQSLQGQGIAGKLTQDSEETFTNPFGQTMHYSEVSDIRKQYQSNGYELRGWVDDNGSFKFN